MEPGPSLSTQYGEGLKRFGGHTISVSERRLFSSSVVPVLMKVFDTSGLHIMCSYSCIEHVPIVAFFIRTCLRNVYIQCMR